MEGRNGLCKKKKIENEFLYYIEIAWAVFLSILSLSPTFRRVSVRKFLLWFESSSSYSHFHSHFLFHVLETMHEMLYTYHVIGSYSTHSTHLFY